MKSIIKYLIFNDYWNGLSDTGTPAAIIMLFSDARGHDEAAVLDEQIRQNVQAQRGIRASQGL